MESLGEMRTKEFVRYIETLSKNASDRIVAGFEDSQKEIMERYLVDTWDLIKHNESVIGLENLLNNIYEVDFKIDKKAIELAKAAIQEWGMDYEKWKFIEKLTQ